MPAPDLTPSQARWFATVRANLERDTGRTLDEWAELARACPETAPRARLAWMKATHGLAQNRASLVLAHAFPPAAAWNAPEELEATLWAAPRPRAIFHALRDLVLTLPGVIVGQRKGYTAFSRNYQFAAARPDREGVALGLALGEPAPPPGRRESWSERLTSRVLLASRHEVDGTLRLRLQAAWERS